MARGKQGKARRKEQRKDAQKEANDMLDGAHDFGLDEDDEDLPTPPSQAPRDSGKAEDDDEIEELILPPPKKKSSGRRRSDDNERSTKYENRARKAAMAASGPSKGIRTTPLILLIIMTGTTLLPALIYASDYLGAFLAKNNVMGSIGYRLGIGQTPKKRVLSFYEKHDPSKIPEVPKILGKYYGDYPKLIKNLERKYQDYGYFLDWEQDEAPMTLAFEQLEETRQWFGTQFNTYAPQPIKTAVRNIRYNLGTLNKKFRKVWKKHLWPLLEPIVGVPKGGAAQKRKDAQAARNRKAQTTGRRRKNTEYRDDIEDEH